MKKSIRISLSILSGLLFGLAWTEWASSLFFLVAFVPLLLVEDNLYQEREANFSILAFYYAFPAFIIWNLWATWWISLASLGGMLVIITLNTLFMSSVFWLFHIGKRLHGAKTGSFLFIILWMAFEYFHTNWELSWSWLNIGNVFGKDPKLIQWYEYTGALGGTLWVLIVNLLLFQTIKAFRAKRYLRWGIPFLLMIIVPVAISLFIFNSFEIEGEKNRVVIIQPNIEPYVQKFEELGQEEQMDIILGIASQKADVEVDYFIAPETSIITPFWEDAYLQNPHIKKIFGFLSAYPNSEFIIGAVTKMRYQPGADVPVTAKILPDGSYYETYNSALQISSDGSIEIYHKSKLVIGVETMPFPEIFGTFNETTVDLGGQTGMLGVQWMREVFTSDNSEAKVAPVICYESAYGDFVNGFMRNGANAIFLITNDGWWKNTSGFYQHTRCSILRAIETRRSIARCGNTGISGIISPKGEFEKTVDPFTETVFEGEISLNDELTAYSKNGDFLGRIFTFLAVLGLFYMLVARIKAGRSNL